ncbi:MAG: TCR/Tet family MFS transporter [Microscillaceae bacterium]|nr:TCR/Tet family MFS transporter [Microscillaceae bacterium]
MKTKQQAAIGFIFITILIDIIGLGIIIPVLPSLITELTGGNLSEASLYGGWLIFAYALMQFVFSPVLGGLSDQFGRRPILLFSLLGLGVDYLFLAVAPTIGWLFLGRLIAGITGASITTASAYIADISTPEKRAQNFGLLGAAFGLGFIIGPVTGGILGEYGTRIPFYAAAGLTLLNWLYGFFILPESLKPENRRFFTWSRANPIGTLSELRKYPVIIGLLTALVFVYIAAHATQSTWSYFTMERFDWGEAEVGYSLGFVGVMIALVQGIFIRPVIQKIGEVNAVYAGLSFNALGFLLFAFADQSWMMYVFMIPYAFGGLAGPSLQGIMTAQVPADAQGELQGGLTSLISLTSIIGPPLMTGIFAHYTHPDNPVYFAGAAFLLAFVLSSFSILLAARSFRRYGIV